LTTSGLIEEGSETPLGGDARFDLKGFDVYSIIGKKRNFRYGKGYGISKDMLIPNILGTLQFLQ
jgi:hypothetical protein